MNQVIASLACMRSWLTRLRRLSLATWAVATLLSLMIVVSAQRNGHSPVASTNQIEGDISARLASLEIWRDEVKKTNFENRLTVIETTLTLQDQHRTWLWAVFGTTAIGFLSQLVMLFISRRIEKPKARAAR